MFIIEPSTLPLTTSEQGHATGGHHYSPCLTLPRSEFDGSNQLDRVVVFHHPQSTSLSAQESEHR